MNAIVLQERLIIMFYTTHLKSFSNINMKSVFIHLSCISEFAFKLFLYYMNNSDLFISMLALWIA